ncbi:hypothetical protein AEM51_12490 [Bacteroidetes bacterium UKL13-3]|nr:hypothetical protein AEM51_12490 [Bacteroidetes bacterium UKL13-3]HCP94373.1 hypothetical protein [Bacteroidota bacterium]
MKRIFYTLSLIALTLGANAQFTANNIAVLRVGDSTSTLANTGNTLAIDQFTSTGTYVNSIILPKTGTNAVALSGTATTEGTLTLSTNRNIISFIAYKLAPPNATNITSVASSTINKVVVSLNAAGSPTFPVLTTSSFSATSPRSVISDGTGFWAAGGNTGVTYSAGVNNIDTVISSNVTNIRVLNVFGGQLYFSTGSGTIGIHRVGNGTPSSSGNTSVPYIPTGPGSSPYGFAINNDSTICYIADDRSTGLGGIQKWTRSGTTWTLAYTLGTGVTNIGARGLVVNWSSKPTLFATTAETNANRLIRLVDSNSTAIAVTIATAPALTVFRGVTMTPGSNPLPVKYSSFNANKSNNSSILKWSTASETNNSHFEIQRSVDGKNFEAIGKVKGSGNSNRSVNYSFTDKEAATTKTTYYRLKQVDFDGKSEYSKTVSVVNTIAKAGIGATLPNPFNNDLNVTVNASSATVANIVIMDMIGKIHHTSTEQLQSGVNTISINTTDMPDGIYFVRVSYNGETYTQKVIKK